MVIEYFYRLCSIKSYYKIMAIIPCALQQILVAYLFYTQQLYLLHIKKLRLREVTLLKGTSESRRVSVSNSGNLSPQPVMQPCLSTASGKDTQHHLQYLVSGGLGEKTGNSYSTLGRCYRRGCSKVRGGFHQFIQQILLESNGLHAVGVKVMGVSPKNLNSLSVPMTQRF